MKRSRKNYGKINTLEELKLERKRLHWQIELAEENFKREYVEVKSMFTWENLAASVLERFNVAGTVMNGIMGGIGVVGSLFSGKKNRKKKACRRIDD